MASGDRLRTGAALAFGVLAVRAAGHLVEAPTLGVAVGTLLHGMVAVLLLRQRPGPRPDRRGLAVTAPSFLLGPLAAGMAADPMTWPWASSLVFASGGALAAWSFLSLGTSFGIMPAVRGLKTGGPYRFVRHPAYAGEGMMVAAALSTGPGGLIAASLATLFFLLAILPRIRAEEFLLAESAEAAFSEFASRVRYRLVPGIY